MLWAGAGHDPDEWMRQVVQLQLAGLSAATLLHGALVQSLRDLHCRQGKLPAKRPAAPSAEDGFTRSFLEL